MSWKEQLNGDSVSWLLEEQEPGVRYLALRDLLDLPDGDPELEAARREAHTRGPIAAILEQMDPEGWWSKPGAGYNPKYFSTVWSLVVLAQLGARANLDERLAAACVYILEHALTTNGQFSGAGAGAPSSTIDCLQGNLITALMEMGWVDSRLEKAYEWAARSTTGAGVAPMGERDAPLRYYAGKIGPGFKCGANNKLPCAWGAVKVMLAFGMLAPEKRTPLIDDAIQVGIDFLLGVDPAKAEYPTGYAEKPSGNWWKLGFPVFYVTDLLQIVEALAKLGLLGDPRLANALDLIRGKQDKHGRWALEYDYRGKMWVDFGSKKQPNKWVTLRALRVLKECV